MLFTCPTQVVVSLRRRQLRERAAAGKHSWGLRPSARLVSGQTFHQSAPRDHQQGQRLGEFFCKSLTYLFILLAIFMLNIFFFFSFLLIQLGFTATVLIIMETWLLLMILGFARKAVWCVCVCEGLGVTLTTRRHNEENMVWWDVTKSVRVGKTWCSVTWPWPLSHCLSSPFYSSGSLFGSQRAAPASVSLAPSGSRWCLSLGKSVVPSAALANNAWSLNIESLTHIAKH